jgi:radical SAM-linked protein
MKHIVPEHDLKQLLLQVEKPGRYVGGEYGISQKACEEPLRVAVSYPDLYDIGMSNQAVKIIYGILNSVEGLCCERVFAPAPDFEAGLRAGAVPLYSLESGLPLHEFDIIAFSVGYELTLTNVLNILDLGEITVRREHRGPGEPIILAGGPAVTNPAPFSVFFDCIFIGEAEEWLPVAFSKLVALKKRGAAREDLLACLCSFVSVWSLGRSGPVKRSVNTSFPTQDQAWYLPVSNIKTVQDHGVVEIMRGCPNGCRFCHAAYYYRPQRVKRFSHITSQVEEQVFMCGYREITLASLSSGDVPGLERMVRLLSAHYKQLGISFSLPSLRIDSVALGLFEELQTVRKSGLTFAIESVFPHGQQSINKCVPHEKTVELLLQARNMGWKQAKFYFMLGLPGFIEHDESAGLIEYITELQARTGMYLHINLSTFVPKPHTPFQWEEQLPEETAFARILAIKKGLKLKPVKISYHAPYQSFLEGMISRGDKRVGELVHKAFLAGARLDAWEDYYKRDIWRWVCGNASFNVEKETYRSRTQSEKLPWQVISLGASENFLHKEHQKALAHVLSEPCSRPCKDFCGMCSSGVGIEAIEDRISPETLTHAREISLQNTLSRILFCFRKTAKAVFLSHLDIVRIFERSFLRAGYFAQMSTGFNPKPKFEFASPLSLGFSSLHEIAACTFYNFNNEADFKEHINSCLPKGLEIVEVKKLVPYKTGEKKHSLMSLYWGSDYSLLFNLVHTINEDILLSFSNIISVSFDNSSHISFRYKFLEKNQNIQSILKDILHSADIYSLCTVRRNQTYARGNNNEPVSYFEAVP